MKTLKIQIGAFLFLAACLIVPLQSMAQWSIGASYEIRQEDPKNGFGLRIERDILKPIPIIDIGLRAHFSYFETGNSNKVYANPNMPSGPKDATYYDYGLAATGGVSLGLLKPYIGLGIGSNTFDVEDGESDTKFFWNSFVGAELTPIPILHPFIEYRFQPTDEADFAPSSDGRLILGISLAF